MKFTSYLTEDSKKWWHLWSCESLCPKINKEIKAEKISDKSEDTRTNILLAAFNETYHRGFQAASLSNILKNTGATKGALYHHFDNKLELGYAVLDEVIRDTMYSSYIEPLNNSNDPITTLRDILLRSGASMTEEDVNLGCPLNNLAQEMSPIDDGFRDRIALLYLEWQDSIEAAFNRGKEKGTVIHSVDAKETALLFIATLQGCMGFAKSVQKLDALMSCGQGLIDRLESLRPLK
ncbi:MAG: TetR/AcrR family transcriptional regulator [Cocleimonas sp.]